MTSESRGRRRRGRLPREIGIPVVVVALPLAFGVASAVAGLREGLSPLPLTGHDLIVVGTVGLVTIGLALGMRHAVTATRAGPGAIRTARRHGTPPSSLPTQSKPRRTRRRSGAPARPRRRRGARPRRPVRGGHRRAA